MIPSDPFHASGEGAWGERERRIAAESLSSSKGSARGAGIFCGLTAVPVFTASSCVKDESTPLPLLTRGGIVPSSLLAPHPISSRVAHPNSSPLALATPFLGFLGIFKNLGGKVLSSPRSSPSRSYDWCATLHAETRAALPWS
jgi:hypothetical protein